MPTANPDGTPAIPNYMTLPGTPQKGFDVFCQFDEDEPYKVDTVKHIYDIQITGTPVPKIAVGEYTPSFVQFSHNGKTFKIFLKPRL